MELLGLLSGASAINRDVGYMNNSYLARSLYVYKSSSPPDPETLKTLIDEYDRANDQNDTSVTSTPSKISMMRGPDKRDNALVLMAKIIYEQKNAGMYDDVAKLFGETSFQGDDGNTFWVFLFKKAALKYTGYWSSNALHAITSDVTGATPEEKYQKQTAAINSKIRADFFSDAAFKTSYLEYKTNKKFTGGSGKKNMRGRRGTHKPTQKKHARKSIRTRRN